MKQYMTPEQNRIFWLGFFYGGLVGVCAMFILCCIILNLALR